ncbi:MAG: PEP-CTERM sorting domain-containing protein [Puniceicoccaceae bacterium]|nr:PEP-CTERM sorting domain-containing protein [Puniceicoccaceae bacterium]
MSFGAVAFERSVAIQIAGVVNFDSFIHSYGTGTDSITVSAVTVPEPSSYALLAGLFACTYMMVRRRAVS